MSSGLAVRLTGIFPSVPAGQSTTDDSSRRGISDGQ